MKALLRLTLCFLTLWLVCLQPSHAQSLPAALKIAPLLTKPLTELERQLGKPRHIGEEKERYYKADGFVRIVVYPTPQKTIATITFQFLKGMLKDETEALTKVGLPDGVLPNRWTSHWAAPGPSKNDELTLSQVQEEPKRAITQKVILTRHFLERMKERGISEAQATDLLENGQRFYDPKNDSYIRYKNGIYIALTKDGVLKTVVRGPLSQRWKPLE